MSGQAEHPAPSVSPVHSQTFAFAVNSARTIDRQTSEPAPKEIDLKNLELTFGNMSGLGGRLAVALKWIFFVSVFLSVIAAYLWRSLGLPYRQLFGEVYERIEASDKLVALTFDDGPHPLYTNEVLKVLDHYRIKATFFMVGQKIVEYPKVAYAVYNAGHELGNHSYSHPWMVLKSLSFVRSEIDRTDLLLRGIGVAGDIYFRSPYSAQLFSLPLILWQRGKKNILADVEPRDWEITAVSLLAQRVLDNVKPGSIIGLHDGGGDRSRTVRALERIIPKLLRRGFHFVTIRELLAHGKMIPADD